MKRIHLAATLLACAALAFSARTASAQASVDANLTTKNGTTDEGVFHVNATQTAPGSLTWDISVNWVSDIAEHPAWVDQVQVGFVDSGGTTITQVGAPGAVGPAPPAAWAGPFPLFGNLVEWANPIGTSLHATATSIQSGESFTASSTLTSPTQVKYVHFILSNGGAVNVLLDVTPEPASLVLLLPGLIPVGLMLRRRRDAARSAAMA